MVSRRVSCHCGCSNAKQPSAPSVVVNDRAQNSGIHSERQCNATASSVLQAEMEFHQDLVNSHIGSELKIP